MNSAAPQQQNLQLRILKSCQTWNETGGTLLRSQSVVNLTTLSAALNAGLSEEALNTHETAVLQMSHRWGLSSRCRRPR
ncbi:hypothetical protein JOB18_040311 [Solea senegalensis]|uniref:Uncharacterized protein n=1 Tax=Solea senegalensis TaxID=28829 RepID=A0AAV6PYQ9_SOLSE|nr:hypothetical protein JOB18_040311 [Solea senegalensis]